MTDLGLLSILPNVSRETEARLRHFAELVKKWTPRINLVSKSSVDHLWERHILDSAQLYALAPSGPGHWVDLGSGGGFPGIVVSILATDAGWGGKVTLVESDQRKVVFLRTAARELSLDVNILADRSESIPQLNATVLSARALAPLVDLIPIAAPHLATGAVAIFPKGRNALEEIERARSDWRFDLDITPSKTDPEAQILKLTRITRA